jgi:hypothetical protein
MFHVAVCSSPDSVDGNSIYSVKEKGNNELKTMHKEAAMTLSAFNWSN